MTDEEKADEYAKRKGLSLFMAGNSAQEIARVAYLDGLAEGRKENEHLKQQIEKMKCCGNCNHYVYDCGERYCRYDATREKDCINKNQWEFD